MQYIKQSMVALSVLLIGVGCSEGPNQKELTDETIRLNKTLIDEGAINPKTQYLKNDKDIIVASKVNTAQHTTIAPKNDIKIVKLISERDATINANLEMEKIIANLKSEKLTLNEKIEQLMKTQKEHQISSKEKITASASALIAAQQLTADRDIEITKLTAERDEAIKVTLEMKKASADLESQKLNLDGKIQTLLQTQSKHESSLKEKITAAASAVEQLASDKDTQISELIKERDEAIRVTLQMKKNNANLEAEKLNSDGKIQTLLQIQNKHESSLKEKITAAASAVEQLASDKDTQISELIKERDEAIRVTLEMKKSNANLEAEKLNSDGKIQTLLQIQSKHESSLKEKITAAASAVEQLASDKDTQISKLIKERDEAIKVTLEMKKSNANLKAQISQIDQNTNAKIEDLQLTKEQTERALEDSKRELDDLTNKVAHLNDDLKREKESFTNFKIEQKQIQVDLKEKLTAAASELTDVKSLTSDRDGKINRLVHDRDDAIKVTLEMKKANADLEAQKLELDKKIQTLIQTQNNNESLSKDKIAAAAAALLAAQQLTADRDTNIETLINERDEAIKVTLEMKKTAEDFEAQKLELDGKIQTLMQSQSDNESTLNEKITTSNSKLEEAQKIVLDKDTEIASLLAERDDAIKVTLEMKKANANLEAQKLELDGKAQTLIQSQSDNESILNEKITTSNSKLEEAQKIVLDKDTEIASLLAERDDAIKVTLEMKKANTDLEAQKSELNGKIQTLLQTQSKHESSLKDKITAAATAVEQLTSDKDTQISKLIKERDEAIKVTLEMKRASADLESQKSELDGKIQTLMQTESENKSSAKEKIANLATLITKAEQLALAKDEDVAKLIKERDSAIQVSIGMKKEYEAQKIDLDKQIATLMQEKTQNKSLSNEKISKLAVLLEEAEKAIVEHDTDIERLTKERDAAIQVTVGMQKKLEDSAQKIKQEKLESAQNAKKLVIDNIVNTFKLSKVEFKTGSAILTKKSTILLDKVADIMKAHSEYNYKVQGHTDSQGKKEFNLRLSEDRAKSVKDYLISKGVSDNQLSSEGFGSLIPIADNTTAEGRLKNRRVVFEIVD